MVAVALGSLVATAAATAAVASVGEGYLLATAAGFLAAVASNVVGLVQLVLHDGLVASRFLHAIAMVLGRVGTLQGVHTPASLAGTAAGVVP